MCACTASYSHYPSHIPYCNLLYALICFRIRTILLAFRRVSVCVCLYGFVFALFLSLSVGRASACACTASYPHYPLLSTTSLPPLSKGGGLTARHKLLLCCVLLAIRLPFQFIKLFCRQDGGIASPPSLACTNPPKPALSPALHHILTPLAKGELLLLSFAQPTIEDSSHQHRRKHFAYWQGVNNFVSVSVQLH